MVFSSHGHDDEGPSVPTLTGTTGRGQKGPIDSTGRKLPRWFNLAAATVMLVVAALCAGLVIGWVGRGALVPSSLIESAISPTSTLPAAQMDDSLIQPMPDVRGLLEADARQVLADAGYSPEIIKTDTTPSLLPSGTIAAQAPVQGTKNAASIVLSLPAPAVMPELAGKTVEEAGALLARMGADAKIVRVYEQTKTPGVVFGTSPAQGKPLTSAPELTVAATPATAPLTALETKGNCLTATSGSVNGAPVTTGVSCVAREQASTTYWILGRTMGRLRGIVGIDDDSDPKSKAHVTITADGKVLLSRDFTYGQSEKIDVDVSKVLRLEVATNDLSDSKSGLPNPSVIWAEATLYASAEAISALESTP